MIMSTPFCAYAEDNIIGHYVAPRFTNGDINISVDTEFYGSTAPDISSYGLNADDTENAIVDTIGTESTPKLYVEVSWDEMKFLYDFGTVIDYKWDIRKLKYNPVYEYDFGTAPSWNKDYINLKFTNYSNRNIWARAYFIANPDTDIFDDVDLTPDKKQIELLTAVGRKVGDPHSQTIKLRISGKPEKTHQDNDKLPSLGLVKFTISHDAFEEENNEAVAEEKQNNK